MKRYIDNVFYFETFAPNVEDLNEILQHSSIDNTDYPWSKNCGIDVLPQSKNILAPLVPTLKSFVQEFQCNYAFDIVDPCLYWFPISSFLPQDNGRKKYDMTLLYFCNYGKDYSKLRLSNSMQVSDVWKTNAYPELDSGKVIIFPSHINFEFTRHNNPDLMKVLRCNFTLDKVTK